MNPLGSAQAPFADPSMLCAFAQVTDDALPADSAPQASLRTTPMSSKTSLPSSLRSSLGGDYGWRSTLTPALLFTVCSARSHSLSGYR